MKGKDVLKGLIEAGKPSESALSNAPSQRPAGAIKALNLGLSRLSEDAAEAKQLREALANAENVVELDPAIIDSSIVADRLTSSSDQAFEELKIAISNSGQQVPVLIRPHPQAQGRYQAAYGHRRIRAAKELGIKVKAVVRHLSDEQLVVAQGQENGTRVDLSFIERALFAYRLEQRGFDRDTLGLALGVDKPELSRLLTVASSIDQLVVEAIGPAPKIGRPRWLQLVEALTNHDSTTVIHSLLGTDEFKAADSDARFKLVLNAAYPAAKPLTPSSREYQVRDKRIAVLDIKGSKSKLLISDPDFTSFLEGRMSSLIEEYLADRD